MELLALTHMVRIPKDVHTLDDAHKRQTDRCIQPQSPHPESANRHFWGVA